MAAREVITYSHGGKLVIPEKGSPVYYPSLGTLKKIQELKTPVKFKGTHEERCERYSQNKQLFEQGVCILGNRLITRIIKGIYGRRKGVVENVK